jgi:hypothetical protein
VIKISFFIMFPWLTLDESTLFYWTLSDASHKKRKHISAISEWALEIPAKSTTSHASGSKSTTSGRSKTVIPSLTHGTSASGRSYAPSVLSDDVKIISHPSSILVKVKNEPAPALSLLNNGGLSDNDEIKGEEREFAVNSPPKGKKRITSEVLFFF